MNADGSNVIRLTDHPATDRSPSWSPDGTKIAFMSNRDGNWEIYSLDLQTRQLKNLTNSPTEDTDPFWSPDGSKIIFIRRDAGKPWSTGKVHIMNPDGTGVVDLKALTSHGQARPAFSPDGRKILFPSDYDEFGKWMKRPTNVPNVFIANVEIFIMNRDGSDLRKLTQHIEGDHYAVWSPDGSQIAFFSHWDGVPGVYLMRADGSDVRLLSQLFDAEPQAWAAPSLIVGVEAKGKLAMTWGEVKSNKRERK